MFGFSRRQNEVAAPAPVDSRKEIERSLAEIRREVDTVRSVLATSTKKLSENQTALQALCGRASELEDALNTVATLLPSVSGAEKDRYKSLAAIAERELEQNRAQRKELEAAIAEQQAFVAKHGETVAELEERVTDLQSTVDALRVRKSTAEIETKINSATETLREFRRDVFVSEALAELRQ